MGLQFFDQYSLLHFAVGVIMYFFNVSFILWNLIHILFEISENSSAGIWFINQYLTIWPGGKNYPDSMSNRFGDIVSGALGWTCAYLLDWYGSKQSWYSRHLSFV